MQKQPSSSMCFVCGRDNPIGLHLHFFTDAAGAVHARYIPLDQHQGFPGVMHGGLVTTILDELIGRTAIAHDWWCMTAKLQIRFHHPVPIGMPLDLRGEIVKKSGRLLQGRGEIRNEQGQLLAHAEGTYLQIPDDQIESYRSALGYWRVDD